MWASILAIFPIVAGWINQIVGFFQARAAAQDAANAAEAQAEATHQKDGAQSVSDRESADAQNAALDDLAKQLDQPVKPS